ncbi:MAG TPA: biopolymer transporter ExbD [Bacteriovoracaceae bacterium]|nr:biopolymer transporter ExbD [Bacteriovoracaceae bacterium]
MARRNRREQLAMDLTPLIDVVFLLLIFFLVTSTFKKEELALLLKLPKSEQGAGNEKKTEQLTIELSNEDIAVNGKKSSIEELPGTFKTTAKDTLVNLRVDGEVKYTRLVKVLDLLQLNKLENVSLITDKDK